MRKPFSNIVCAFLLCLLLTFATVPAFAKETIDVTDHRGIVVKIPAKIERVVISSILPLPSVYCLYRGGPKNLVAIPAASMAAAKHSYLAKVYPEILNLNSDFAKGGSVNIEEIIKLKPDVVFYRANEEAEAELYKKAGIPAVAFSTTIAGVNTINTFAAWIDLLEKIFGKSQRAAEIIAYGNEVLEKIQTRVKSLPDKERTKTLIVFSYSGGQLNAGGSNFFSEFWIGQTGGKNVAASIKGRKSVNMEQIYSWDPDVILITNFCPYVPEDFYGNKIEGYNWSNLKATKNKRIFKFPLGMYRWFPPASDTPLCLLWLAKHIQPERFEDIDMDKEITSYYKRFYDRTLTKEDLKAIYNPPRDAAIY